MNKLKVTPDLLQRAAEFYARCPDGQYDEVAFRAIVRWLHQMELAAARKNR